MLDFRRMALAAPVLHAVIFSLTWLLDWIQPQALFDGPSRYPFLIIFIGDLPFSAFFFGIIFTSSERFIYAVVSWGIVGSSWWWCLGSWIDKVRYRRR